MVNVRTGKIGNELYPTANVKEEKNMPSVLIGGGSGLIGTCLSQLLQEEGFEVLHLSRSPRPDAPFRTFKWDVEKGEIDEQAIRSADYVVNLAGAGIADKLWTASRKALIMSSRRQSTELLAKAFQRLEHYPKAYLASTAIGYYGDRGNEWVDENSPAGEGFLADSTQAWEQAIQQVEDTGVRTVRIRIGIVLSTQGGALEKMLIPFRFYAGTYFGDGQQWYSWVHIDDLCRLFIHALRQTEMTGVYNGVAPNPVTNKALTEAVKRALQSPALLLPAPAFALRLAMGEMADVVLDSARVKAEKTIGSGFEFRYPEVQPALEDLLARKV